MLRFDASEFAKKRPEIQMTSMIDIMFINLLFFMALFVFFHFETELNVTVPKAQESTETRRVTAEIIVNVLQDGRIVVNQKQITLEALASLLRKAAELYPEQAVVLRADKHTYHENVVKVLDSCAKAKIWNISFATTREK